MNLKTVIVAIMAAGFALPTITSAAGDAPSGQAKFNALDVNKDGVIDRQEAAADPDVAAAFDRIDAAGTGEIKPEDFAAWEEVSKPADPAMESKPADPSMELKTPKTPAY
jgi:hypothetical protein